ncbi:uncharacterized protein BP5553_07140 [Venustampulla echinocandica]|uniref:Transcription factor domain-containing protein n=1 Tax=Venustampulla echinocandica TaxID=2656787 RepID=A0A370TIM7_9HELO|nr:uncharacterized protein BP5553_07140 [Venustampulla echinocandica]RDL35209.1 hypothetical protein BP5553_07140 [Venustampulla echinocandica]
MRCIKANRPCGGYENDASPEFRQYEARNPSQLSSSSLLIARKCVIPKRVPIPGTDILPEDAIPPETSEEDSNMLALRCFLYDYYMISANRSLSRSYLSGLDELTHRLGPKSDLAKACQVVAFASHAKPLHRPRFIRKSGIFYQELLASLARAIEGSRSGNSVELKVIAMSLGLYQIVMANETGPGDHDAHAKGLSALWGTTHLPLNPLVTTLCSSTKTLQISNYSNVFSVPALCSPGDSLEHLLFHLHLVWAKFEVVIASKDLETLKVQSLALDQRFAMWEETRVDLFKPTVIGHVRPGRYESEVQVGAWPGKVDTYFDLYVAGVWNIFRTARLLLVALIIELSNSLAEYDSCTDHIRTANRIAQDMVASVPYHLADNLQVFLNEKETSGGITDPGRFLGGLLLMHPLYVVSKMPFLSETLRKYFRSCLLWIGSEMGVGQATLFANASDIDRDYLASGCIIIWSGFLM